ncbi:cysteine proteinase [Backusella circina FSU 941]|nr:cysteine proteinase [Backusella circina FSU 941]
MSSALQCLSNTPQLTRWFLTGKYKSEINRNNPLGMNGLIAEAYGDLIEQIWTTQQTSLRPVNFKFTISKFNATFSGFLQHDTQELLAFLLDGLHEDLNRITVQPYIELPDFIGLQEEEIAQCSWEYHLSRNDSIIVDLFQGQFRSTLVCKGCHNVSVTFDPFMYLSLPLPVHTNDIRLSDCLDGFTREEDLSERDLWHCPKCKQQQHVTKKLDIWRLPTILVIHLKRFRHTPTSSNKIEDYVDFPMVELDMTDRVVSILDPDSVTPENRLVYDLYAVDNHYGIDVGGGHYIAFAQNCEDGKWYEFDDANVDHADMRYVQSEAAYLLFYKRRETPSN